MTHSIVFNVYELGPGLYLPNAFIVKESVTGGLGYIEQKATKDTLPSFEAIQVSDELMRLINKVNAIHPQEIADKYNSNKKKSFTIAELVENDQKVAPILKGIIHKKFAELMREIVRLNQVITFKLPRKDEAKSHVIEVSDQQVEPLLSFKLKDYGIVYELRVLEDDQRVKVWETDLQVLSNQPAWVMINKKLYHIPHIKGLMLKPFAQKEHLFIPPKSIITYFEKFILKVASKAEIQAEGFDMTTMSKIEHCRLEVIKDVFSDEWVLHPVFKYKGADVSFGWNDQKKHRLSLNTEDDQIKVIKILRDRDQEKAIISKLSAFKLTSNASGNFSLKGKALTNSFYLHEWLIDQREALKAEGFMLEQMGIEQSKIYAHKASLEISATQEEDWFDVKAVVRVGTFQIAFVKFINHIKNKESLFELPNGEFMIIPAEWFTKYQQFSTFGSIQKELIRFTKSQYTILEETGILKKNRKGISKEELNSLISADLKAELRPYQLEGVHWMAQLNQKGLGGCLADDMGLGKTLQTISVLLYAKKSKSEQQNAKQTKQAAPVLQGDLFANESEEITEKDTPLRSLIVLPASLVYNWQAEIKKFAPSLSVLSHTGVKRDKVIDKIAAFDVVLTTYHTALRDFDVLNEIHWEYIVLDESQQIKNKDGKVFRSISKLKANHKLALSGTPIENSLSDLWSQMQFINPNLLGGYTFFRNEFKTPIERRADEGKKKALYNLVKPYLLRRTKRQVAKDLPDLTIKTFYSEMTQAQNKWYEAEKSAVRNYLLNVFDRKKGKDQVHMLQSLMKLRQLANHTALADYEPYEGAKFEDVIHQWKTVIKSGHKVLIFSSFVKYLQLFEDYFKQEGVAYSFLHGSLSAKQKKAQIDQFEEDQTNKTFLISIKAGGTGLNLTSADYVFILDPWWNPFVEKQAIARAHRIGQDKNVVAIKFVTKNTIEEKILRLQEKKTLLAEDIIKDEETKLTLSDEVLKSLVE